MPHTDTMKIFSPGNLFTSGIALLISTILIVFFVSNRQFQRVRDTSGQVSRTRQVIQHIQKLVMAALDNETGARGYAISGKDEFLEPLIQSGKSFAAETTALQQLLSDNPGQLQRLDSIRFFIGRRMHFSDSMVITKKTGTAAELVSMVESGLGKHYSDQIRRIGTEMEHIETELLAIRKQDNEQTIRQLNTILYSILAFIFLLGFFMIRRLHRDYRKQVASEQRFSALLDAVPDATVITDEQGRIRVINRQAEELFGYTKQEMNGQSVEILVPPALRSAHIHHRNSFMRNAHLRAMGAGLDLFAVRKNGSEFPVEISLSPIQTDEGLLVIASVRDITQRKTLETALRRSNAELEAFTYSVSHDLRAPLRGIVGFTTILEEDYHDKLDEEGHRITGVIKSNTLRMGYLIDDLLAFSRLGRQEIVKANVNTDALVREIIKENIKPLSRSDIQWSITQLPPVYADLNTLRQAWINLLSNAVKYSAKKERPEIEIGHYTDKGQQVFFVKDNGVGFDNKYRDKLFRVFQRLHNEADFEGTGVGLALVEKIVARHGGKVWAEGKEGEGACFFFSLPDPTTNQKTEQ